MKAMFYFIFLFFCFPLFAQQVASEALISFEEKNLDLSLGTESEKSGELIDDPEAFSEEKAHSLSDELNPYGFGIEDEKEYLNPYGKLLKKAAEGDVEAQIKLAQAFFKGEMGLEKDYSQAMSWYKEAAAQQHPLAYYKLGQMHQWGRGTKQDLEKAFQWFLKAAQKQYPTAYLKVASMYEKGLGTVVDFKEAKAWYIKAAKANETKGLYHLGKIYFHGLGVKQDLVKAYALYSKAAARGFSKAAEMRDLSLHGLSSLQIEKAQKLAKKPFEISDY